MKHLFSLFLFTTISCFAQKPIKDTIYGPVKTVYEKMIITDTAPKNPDDIYYDDYGEFGFMGR
ncbi:hypothetical protein [Flavobacterium psychrotrophum]|uniref:hypothetical protein n=1 Tax=Flavobacterium psychrotrophum TaxID=2294119 RepID=UPI000E314B8B|nr:hypothetical protein [Flavobacterium psychrotrophum]